MCHTIVPWDFKALKCGKKDYNLRNGLLAELRLLRKRVSYKCHKWRYIVIWYSWVLLLHSQLYLHGVSVVSIMNNINNFMTLQWHHNGHNIISNHQPHDCLLNRLFRHRSKKTSKLRITGFCVGNSPATSEFPVQMVSNTEDVSIWYHH